jgi:hypothetical protein
MTRALSGMSCSSGLLLLGLGEELFKLFKTHIANICARQIIPHRQLNNMTQS